VPHHFDLVDPGRMIQKGTLYSNAMGSDPADGKQFVDAAPLDGNHDTLKNLNTLAVSFDNTDVDVNGIARPELGSIVAQLLYRLDKVDAVSHFVYLKLSLDKNCSTHIQKECWLLSPATKRDYTINFRRLANACSKLECVPTGQGIDV
jgi:hypothetical protein